MATAKSRSKTMHVCSECGGESPKWQGQCPQCQAWNTLVETGAENPGAGKNRFAALATTAEVAVLSDIEAQDVARTLVAMSQRGTVNDSRRLADTIVRTLGSNGVRLLPRTHRQAGFAVLTSPDIPAALVELGYLSNPQDEKLLTVRQHQLYLARALRASVEFVAGSAGELHVVDGDGPVAACAAALEARVSRPYLAQATAISASRWLVGASLGFHGDEAPLHADEKVRHA